MLLVHDSHIRSKADREQTEIKENKNTKKDITDTIYKPRIGLNKDYKLLI